MDTQDQLNYQRIATAITYLQNHFKAQPDLDQVASEMNLSPFHFQRMFTAWAGVSPKKFLQYLSLNHAKKLLKDKQTLFDVAYQTGFSGTGRLHDLFVTLEGMTPGEYKNGGANLSINYSFSNTMFGEIIIASTPVGVCYLAFAEEKAQSFHLLQSQFPKATFSKKLDQIQETALKVFASEGLQNNPIKLHLKGTPFQLKVWEALLKIPMGNLSSYNAIAKHINLPNASRAVGSAIARNPIAILIPCHRVIKSTGRFGAYHWGAVRKTAILGWEAAAIDLKPLTTSENNNALTSEIQSK